MNFLKHWRMRKPETDNESVYISEKFGVRSLHIGSDTVQSSMRIARPNDLEVAYTRCMMGFLLFRDPPRRVLLVGLGGGSLAKFIYHRIPDARIEAVEISPEVVAVARHYFFLPPDDVQLTVVVGDGAERVERADQAWDVIMVDGYGPDEQASEVASAGFYRDCRRALAAGGTLVVNLWGGDRKFSGCVSGIVKAFDGHTLCLPDGKAGNVAVFGFREGLGEPRWSGLEEAARRLQSQYGLDFPRFVTMLREMNPHDDERLLV